MLRLIDRIKGTRTRTARRTLRPALEGLEDRKLLYATLGDAWTYPIRITYSFVPDGTNVGGLSSNLHATLNTQATTAAWQLAFAKAASYWSSSANINIARVSDNGAPLGSAGNQQGDPNFGDIRIAMANQGSNGVLAATFLPPPSNGGSLAGDIVFNSNYSFRLNSDYDVQTIAIHELGHALGLDHSNVPTADMYSSYQGLRQTLTADDIAGIQAVYGAYPAETETNNTINTASNITPLMTTNGQVAVANLSMTGTSDLDWFYVTAPANTTGTMTVTLQASGLSMLNPRITVYNSAKVGIGQFWTSTNLGGNATVTIAGVTAGQGYYFRASAASSPGAYGAYGLLVNFGSATQPPIAPPYTTVFATGDQRSGSISQPGTWSLFATYLAELKLAMSEYATAPEASLNTLRTVTTQLQGIMSDAGYSSTKAFRDLSKFAEDLVKPKMKKAAKDLEEFSENILQIGSLIGFGDVLTVPTANRTGHVRTETRKPFEPSSGTVISVPPAPGGIHKHSVPHPKGAGSQFQETGSRGGLVHTPLPVAKNVNWVPGQPQSTALKFKRGHS